MYCRTRKTRCWWRSCWSLIWKNERSNGWYSWWWNFYLWSS